MSFVRKTEVHLKIDNPTLGLMNPTFKGILPSIDEIENELK